MTPDAAAILEPRLARRRLTGRLFVLACGLCALSTAASLVVLLAAVGRSGWSLLSWAFLDRFPSTLSPETAGVKSALWGSVWMMTVTALSAVPIGVGAAVYLEEYSRRGRLARLIHLNIANLAGVPSIVYGILGLALFVRWMNQGRSVAAGGLTLALLVLPVIIIAAREALAAVPDSMRQAAYALGATRWQVVRHHVLPAALPGILTGVILALSRAMGEAAPLILLGAVTYIAFVPGGELSEYPQMFQGAWYTWEGLSNRVGGAWDWLRGGLLSDFTTMPIQIYDWADRPQPEFHQLAAAGILVLMAMLLSMNALAIGIRTWQLRKPRW